MKNISKNYRAIYDREKVSRKMKKYILGYRKSRTELKLLLKSVRLGEPIKTMFERREITPYEFCPECGCKDYRGGGNMTEYPEHWENFYCLRCANIVGYIDNSPFIHALECKDENYNPVF